MGSRVTSTCCVLLALCCLQTCLSDSSWDYSGVRSKTEAVTLATGTAPSSKGSTVSPLATPQAVNPLLKSKRNHTATNATNSTRGQGACGDAMFKNWAGAFNYSFSRRDRQEAQKRFCNNMDQVRRINSNASIPYWASGNPYSHLSFAEFTQRYLANLTLKKRPAVKQQQQQQAASRTIPTLSRKLLDDYPTDTVDGAGASSPSPSPVAPPLKDNVNWVEEGKVTPIKNQGGCGSCWAFSAVSVIESMYLIANNASASDPAMQIDLSEQQLVSCVNAASVAGSYSRGCDGGSTAEALDYVAANGLVLESLYPYEADTGSCNLGAISSAAPGQEIVSSSPYQDLPYNDEAALIQAVQAAPTAVYFSVDASFFMYSGGVYTPDPDNSNFVNHAIVVVGFSTASPSDRHWLVRNSWGEGWGEQGYARVQMTGSDDDGVGPCGMYQYSYQPATSFSSAPLLLRAPSN